VKKVVIPAITSRPMWRDGSRSVADWCGSPGAVTRQPLKT
jgi:hypothetical protein